jgi:hypothetical protein
MKVLFICGSAQPQRCGVGDYSRRLAGELIRLGHEASIVSLMDDEILKSTIETQMDLNTAVTVFRLPYSNGYAFNCNEAKSFVDNFDPEWISLQYVPFSFHLKGLPVGLSNHLKLLTEGRNLQIMFHELWVGINGTKHLKIKVWGNMQLKLILSLIKHLKPVVIHTQTTLYQNKLSRLGIHAMLLPLFSNIPLEINQAYNNDRKSGFKNKESISLVLFGSIHKNAPIRQFAHELKTYSDRISKNIKLFILGRSGKEAEKWIHEFQKLNMEVISSGEQDDVNISSFLHKADFGITTSAFDILEKSGSVAAMVEHGLNVICVSTEFKKSKIPDYDRGLFRYSAGNLENFFKAESNLSLKSSFSSLKETSIKLINSLMDSSRN